MVTPSNRFPCVLMLALAPYICAPALAGEAEWAAHMAAADVADRARDYRTAAARYEAALREAESFGADDPRVARTLNNLASLYHAQGRFAEAEPLYRRSLTIFEKASGPDHPRVGLALSNLANLYQAQGH